MICEVSWRKARDPTGAVNSEMDLRYASPEDGKKPLLSSGKELKYVQEFFWERCARRNEDHETGVQSFMDAEALCECCDRWRLV